MQDAKNTRLGQDQNRPTKEHGVKTKVPKYGSTAQASLHWGPEETITRNTNSDRECNRDGWKKHIYSTAPSPYLVTTRRRATLISALEGHPLAFSAQMRALPGTREQACSCLMMWLSSPWRLAPLEFLRASSMFSASTVPSPSASNWAKAYNTRDTIKSHLFQIMDTLLPLVTSL